MHEDYAAILGLPYNGVSKFRHISGSPIVGVNRPEHKGIRHIFADGSIIEAIGRPYDRSRVAKRTFKFCVRLINFLFALFRRKPCQIRMAERMVSDFAAERLHAQQNLLPPLHAASEHKECSAYTVLFQHVKNVRRDLWIRPIIKRKRKQRSVFIYGGCGWHGILSAAAQKKQEQRKQAEHSGCRLAVFLRNLCILLYLFHSTNLCAGKTHYAAIASASAPCYDVFWKGACMFMWIIYAFASAFFAGVTSILAKCGIRKTDSNVATAIRTIVVLLFSWVMVFLVGSQATLSKLTGESLLYLVLSGLATGASWLCYFKALQLGDVNKVVPVDKSSTMLTILLAFFLLHEEITWQKAVGVAAIAAGTYLMIQKKEGSVRKSGKGWFLYAVLSAVFASLTAILGKLGIAEVESNLGTAIRTGVVLIMAWVVVFATGNGPAVKKVPKNELSFICLSGLATGASWLCYYKALQDGLASVVVPIDKLSILVTIAFSYFALHERLSKKALLGLVLIVAGTLAMLVKA